MERKPLIFCSEDDAYLFSCPHCEDFIQVLTNQTACCIFRHGVYKNTNTGLPPHAPKTQCDAAVESGRIYGCGKPFRIVLGRNEISEHGYAEICDYI